MSLFIENNYVTHARLYGHSKDAVSWDLPKSQRNRRLRSLLLVLLIEENKFCTMGFDLFSSLVKKSIYPGISSVSSSEETDRLIECAVFLGFIVLQNVESEPSLIVSIGRYGRLFFTLSSGSSEKSNVKDFKNLLNYTFFLAFSAASFSLGAKPTSKLLDAVHPIRAFLFALHKRKSLTFDEIFKGFYGPNVDDEKFLTDAWPPQELLPPRVEWEGPLAMLRRAELIDYSGSVHSARYGGKYYDPEIVVSTSNLLLDFFDNKSLWDSKLKNYELNLFREDVETYFPLIPPQLNSVSAELNDAIVADKLFKKDMVLRFNRLKQGSFRNSLLNEYHGKCVICGIADEKMLEAAHIVSFEEIYSRFLAFPLELEILRGVADPMNGFLFCSNHHTAFDKGLFEITLGVEPESNYGDVKIVSKDKFFKDSFLVDKVDLHSQKRASYISKKTSSSIRHVVSKSARKSGKRFVT